jgi:hypothetical protein
LNNKRMEIKFICLILLHEDEINWSKGKWYEY